MNSIVAFCFLASVGVSLAVDCGSDIKQQTEVNPDNDFYTLNFWANSGATTDPQEERDAIEGIGRSVWMKSSACFKVKPDESGSLIRICAETKFADAIIFGYKDGSGWNYETETISDNSVFTNKCFNRFEDPIPGVEKMSICFTASGLVKLQNVFASMCIAA